MSDPAQPRHLPLAIARGRKIHFEAAEIRTILVKQILADESAASARKTEKLRGLRLAKEDADRAEALANPKPVAKKKRSAALAR